MKDPNELDNGKRVEILRILKEFNHQYSDYSDVKVGNIIYVNSLLYKSYMPPKCIGVPPEIKQLLRFYCEYDFLEQVDDTAQFRITEFGLRYLQENYNLI